MEIQIESEFCIRCKRPNTDNNPICQECETAFKNFDKTLSEIREPSFLEVFIADEFKRKVIDYAITNKAGLINFDEIKVLIFKDRNPNPLSFDNQMKINIVLPYYRFRPNVLSDSLYNIPLSAIKQVILFSILVPQDAAVGELTEEGLFKAIRQKG